MSKRNTVFRPLCLAIILTAGLGVVWGAVSAWCVSLARQIGQGDRKYEQISFRIDGTPLIATYEYDRFRHGTYRTLEGQPVPLEDSPEEVGYLQGARLRGPKTRPPGLEWIEWQRKVCSIADQGRPPIYWYFIHDGKPKGGGYFVGYNSKTKLLVEYIGSKGFVPNKPTPEECFQMDPLRMRDNLDEMYFFGTQPYQDTPALYFISGDRFVEIDFRKREVGVIQEASNLLSQGWLARALSALPSEDSDARRMWRNYNTLRTVDQVLVFNVEAPENSWYDSEEIPIEHRWYTLPEEVRNSNITFYQLADTTAVVEVDHPMSARSDLFWIDEEGTVLRHEKVDLIGDSPPSPTTEALLFAMEAPVPIAVTTMAGIISPLSCLRSGKEATYSSALARSLSESWPALLAVYLLAAGLAWFSHRWQRQHAMPSTALWVVFVFVLGVPGLLGYLFHRLWPARQACPSCDEEVPRDRTACSHCGSDFPEPEPKGIEVLV